MFYTSPDLPTAKPSKDLENSAESALGKGSPHALVTG